MGEAGASPSGAVSLSTAIMALRSELLTSWQSSQDSRLRFRPSSVEVSLAVMVTSDKSAKAGAKWWLLEAGGEMSRQLGSTHTVKLTLEPVFADDRGETAEFFVSDLDDTAPAAPDTFVADLNN